MKLRDLLTEKKNKHGVTIVTKKSDVNKMLKQVEKAEKALDNVRTMFQRMSNPALEHGRAEHHSWQDAYQADIVTKSQVPNMNYKTEAEQYWHNFRDGLNGSVVYRIRETDSSIRSVKDSLKDLLRIV
jgi:hypothetical protein